MIYLFYEFEAKLFFIVNLGWEDTRAFVKGPLNLWAS